MWKNILRKLAVASKERAVIFFIEVLQDLVADIRRNGHDDRKRTDYEQFDTDERRTPPRKNLNDIL